MPARVILISVPFPWVDRVSSSPLTRELLGLCSAPTFLVGLHGASGQFPQYNAVGKVRVDPNDSSKVAAGTKKGLYFSYDGGVTGPARVPVKLSTAAPGHNRLGTDRHGRWDYPHHRSGWDTRLATPSNTI